MFALPPISPLGTLARSFVGPALSLTAVWTLLCVPGWVMQSHTCSADSVAVIGDIPMAVPVKMGDFVGFAYDGELAEMGGANNDVLEHNSILTRFTQTPSGQLSGWYMVQHDGKPYMGTLWGGRHLQGDSPFEKYEFHWRDQYGTGLVDFHFDPTSEHFGGMWTSDLNPNWHSAWTGTRR